MCNLTFTLHDSYTLRCETENLEGFEKHLSHMYLHDALEAAEEFLYRHELPYVEVVTSIGFVVAKLTPDEEEEEESDNYGDYDECGFNPYLGAYDFDC
jgi:hypothetical protein